MKYIIAITLLVCTATAVEYTLEDCKCGDNFTAQKSAENGKVQCVGDLLDIVQQCNIPQAPRCVCDKDKVNGITSDADGTWCTFSEKGVVRKKWPCENTNEWRAYNIAYDDYKKTLQE